MMRKTLLFIALFLEFAVIGHSAIAQNSSADLGNTSTCHSTPLSVSYTVSSGSARLLIVGFLGDSIGGNDDITAVTYNGVSMTLAIKDTTEGTNRMAYLYYLLAPATGANSVVISCTNDHYILAVASDYTGVKQSGQPDATEHAVSPNATDTLFRSTITTIADNSWAVLLWNSYSSGVAAVADVDGHITRRTYGSAFGEPALFDTNTPITPAGAFTMGTDQGGGGDTVYVVHIAASFAPDTGAVVTNKHFFLMSPKQ